MTDPQHMTALASANATRLARAELHHQVADTKNFEASCAELAEIFAGGVPACMSSMRMEEALGWIYQHGRNRKRFVNGMLDVIGCTEWKLVRDLTVRQRAALVSELRMRSISNVRQAA